MENGIIENTARPYYYQVETDLLYLHDNYTGVITQDRAQVRCHKGFRLVGTNIISCGPDQQFTDLPQCFDIGQ